MRATGRRHEERVEAEAEVGVEGEQGAAGPEGRAEHARVELGTASTIGGGEMGRRERRARGG